MFMLIWISMLVVTLTVAAGILAALSRTAAAGMACGDRAFVAALAGAVLMATAGSYDRAGWLQTGQAFAWAGGAACLLAVRWVAMCATVRRMTKWRSPMIGACRGCGAVRVVDGRDLCSSCGE